MTLEAALEASLTGRVVPKSELPSAATLQDIHRQLDHALRAPLRLVPSPYPLPYPLEDLDE